MYVRTTYNSAIDVKVYVDYTGINNYQIIAATSSQMSYLDAISVAHAHYLEKTSAFVIPSRPSYERL